MAGHDEVSFPLAGRTVADRTTGIRDNEVPFMVRHNQVDARRL
jgi:hypothetical protein